MTDQQPNEAPKPSTFSGEMVSDQTPPDPNELAWQPTRDLPNSLDGANLMYGLDPRSR